MLVSLSNCCVKFNCMSHYDLMVLVYARINMLRGQQFIRPVETACSNGQLSRRSFKARECMASCSACGCDSGSRACAAVRALLYTLPVAKRNFSVTGSYSAAASIKHKRRDRVVRVILVRVKSSPVRNCVA
jgi:hypothetical protein